MASQPNRIAISFRPLLGQVIDCLIFPKPVYGLVDQDRNNAYVRVKNESGISEFVFFGGEACTIKESKERAAQEAMQKLMSQFGVRVSDFTSDKVKMYHLCCMLFKHKCVELCRERGFPIPAAQGNLGKKLAEDVVHVSVDFVEFLGVVVSKTGAAVSSLETLWVEGLGYVSWVIVTCSHNGTGMECIYSDPCSEAPNSQQKATKRAVYYLVAQYNLEIVDANYGDVAEKSAACSPLKEQYYRLKDRIAAGQGQFTQEDYFTLTAEGSQIPNSTVPPAAPIKRRESGPSNNSAFSGVRISEPLVTGLPELETVRKRAKFD